MIALTALMIATYVMAVETVQSDSYQETSSMTQQAPKYISLIEHQHCNEVRLSGTDTSADWSNYMSTHFDQLGPFNDLRNERNTLYDVSFGHTRKINLQFNGRNFSPQTLRETDYVSLDAYAMGQGNTSGRIYILTDRKAPQLINDGESRPGFKAAIIYIHPNMDSSPENVNCQFVSGEIDLVAAEKGQCYWIDASSRGPNGKPYCW